MSAQDDELIRRYREASAQDASRPGPQVRAAVRAHAQMLVAAKAAAGDKPVAAGIPVARRTAANASRWKISALGSVALVGLSALLLLQFERGTPEEKDIAYGPPRAEMSGVAEQPEKPSVASVAPPSAANRAIAGDSAISNERAADRMDAPQATPVPNRAKAMTKVAPSAAETKASSGDAAALSEVPGSASANADAVAVPRAAPPPAPAPAPAAEVAQPASAQSSRSAKAAPPSTMQTAPSVAAETTLPSAAAARSARAAQTAPDPRSDADINAANGNLAAPPADADADKGSASTLEQALREAARAGRAVQVEDLARRGVALDSRDNAGRTALMLAAMNGHTRVVQKLLALGVNTALVDAQGQSAAQQARRRGHPHIADLIDAGS